ncbi:MAG TPA: ABC transporter substrate-binding protein [Anaerolineae bacterium]|nr:ABC transporter substrate-binding protein [Anaerolineae bacterium]
MKKAIVQGIIFCLFSLMLLSCSGTAPASSVPSEQVLTHIRLPMAYIPNVQFAPFYAAVANGFYAEEGLEIEFDYSFETDGVALVAANELQFAVVSGEQVLLARAKGLPVVFVMTWYKDYPVGVVAKAQGIESPRDLIGKHVGIPGLFGASYVGLKAMLDASGVKESDIILDSIGFNQVEALTANQVDAAVIYVANEPVQLKAMGYDVDLLRVADYVQLASNGLITNETTIKDNPDLVRRMVRATLRGINFTINHPDEAFDDSKDYVDGLETSNISVQKEILASSIDLYQKDPFGYSNPLAWENMGRVLLNMGLIDETLDLKAAYTNDFIK